MVNNLKKYWLELTVIVAFLTYTGFINFTLPEGSNLHYGITAHDEYVAVNEVYNILHPFSAKHLFMAVTTGSIQYYGRAMFYTDAIFAFLPEKIWGLSGMVVAIRCFHALLLTISFFILAKTFLQQRFYRVVFLVGALFTFWSIYFGLIPKPEPHQFFAFAIFLWYFKRNDHMPGLYFAWLGLAYGLKISFLVVVPIFFFVSLYSSGFTLRNTIKLVSLFLIGLLIANPYLLLGLVKPIFITAYFKNNFIKNIDDDPTVNYTHWLNHVWPEYYSAGIIPSILTYILIIVLLIYTLVKHKIRSVYFDQLWLITGGLFLLLPVVIISKRLYPHYLWPAYILICLGILIFVDKYKASNKIIPKAISILFVLFGIKYYLTSSVDLINERKIAGLKSSEQSYYLESLAKNNKGSKIVVSAGVYYSFRWLVDNFRYHPFAGSKPFEEPTNRIVWHSTLDTNFINNEKPDILIISDYFFKSKYALMNSCCIKQKSFYKIYDVSDVKFKNMIIFIRRY